MFNYHFSLFDGSFAWQLVMSVSTVPGNVVPVEWCPDGCSIGFHSHKDSKCTEMTCGCSKIMDAVCFLEILMIAALSSQVNVFSHG